MNTIGEIKQKLDIVELDLGDLSTAQQVKLVVSGYTSWDSSKVFDGKKKPVGRFVQVKDQNGDWASIFDNFEVITPSVLPRTYVLDLTGKFLTNDYSVRLGFYPDVSFDHIGLDTSTQQEFKVTTLPLSDSNLHFRGYSNFKGIPPTPPIGLPIDRDTTQVRHGVVVKKG